MDLSKTSFVSAMLDYFGKGNSTVSFMDEIKALSLEDRKYFHTLLTGVGYKLEPLRPV